MDMDKYFDELNDMANFKNFGERDKEIIIDGVDVAGCTILQEIKEIVEKGQWDFAGVTENQILQKITKAESEG